MSRWAIANLNRGELDGQRILKRETIDQMWRPVTDALNLKEGISWFIADLSGHRLVLHAGGDIGFRSFVMLAPDDAVAVVAMSNFAAEGPDFVKDFTSAAMRIMLGVNEISASPAKGPVVAATDLSSDEAKQKADEIVAKYVTALGGRAAMEKLTSRTAKGTYELIGVALSGPLEMFAKAPNKTLMILKTPTNESLKDGFDGTVAWEFDPEEGLREKSGLELASVIRDSDFYQPLKLRIQYPNLSFKGSAKVWLGKGGGGKVQDRNAFVLEAPRNGSPRRFYFDEQTGLLLRVEDWNAAGKLLQASEYDDYREVDGVKVPFIIHQIQDLHLTIKLNEVKHNATIDDTIFAKPKP